MADIGLPTPLFPVRADEFLKAEFLHPGRSHKARVARALVDDAEHRGEISAGRRRIMLERTGGNLGIALAVEARVRGYELTLVTDPHYSRIKRRIAVRLGATVIDRGERYPDCADNQAVIDILLADGRADYLYLNQFGNPANPRAHETGTGAEMLAQLRGGGLGRDVTVVLVGGLGTGASMRGVSRALRTWFGSVLTVGVEPPQCDLLAGQYAEHPFQGIAVGQPAPFFPASDLDAIVAVGAEQAVAAQHELIRRFRILVGPSSGANYAALAAARSHAVVRARRDCIFVTLLYDRGEDYE